MQWHVKPKPPKEFLNQFPEFPSLILQLLYNRGITTQEKIDEFFNPDYSSDLHNPFLLKDIKKAVKRILKAVKNKEKIVIYGDYDTDGVCSTAILYLTLKELGAKKIEVYIPDRDKERHGLNEDSVRLLKKTNTNLIITVDCGSDNIKEVDLARDLDIDVIITDHHEVKDKLPNAIAIVNPKRKDGKYPFRELAGAGVAFKLVQAISETVYKDNPKNGDKLRNFQKWLLDLVAIATVTDVMPIIGENRTLVKYGLGVLAQTRWLGLRELMKVAGINPKVTRYSASGEAPLSNLNTYTLGFILGPRISAASRIDHADVAFKLLITRDKNEAVNLAKDLNEKNVKRQSLSSEIVKEIEKRIEGKAGDEKIIFEGDEKWSAGLVGLVASIISEKYRKPTFISQIKGDIIYTSARSGVDAFNLIDSIKKCSDLLEKYGGHSGAAGFTVKAEKLEEVKGKLTNMAEKILTDEDLVPKLEIDAEISPSDINWESYEKLEEFEPFGEKNPYPKFLVRNLTVNGMSIVGNNGKHLRMTLISEDNERSSGVNLFKAIGFDLGHFYQKVKIGDKIDLVFEFLINEWEGLRDLQLKIIDLKVSKS